MLEHNISLWGQKDLWQAARWTDMHLTSLLGTGSRELRISLRSDKSLTISKPQAPHLSSGNSVSRGPVKVTDKM